MWGVFEGNPEGFGYFKFEEGRGVRRFFSPTCGRGLLFLGVAGASCHRCGAPLFSLGCGGLPWSLVPLVLRSFLS